jgi:hypothetical protein
MKTKDKSVVLKKWNFWEGEEEHDKIDTLRGKYFLQIVFCCSFSGLG